MAFLPFRGVLNTLWAPKTASVAIAVGGALEWTSGALNPAAAATTVVAGVSMREVTSASSDYATSGAQIGYWVATDETEFIADVTNGTATAANVGNRYDLDATGLLVDIGATSHKQCYVTQFISATKLVVKIAGAQVLDAV